MSDADRRALFSHFHEEAEEHIEALSKLLLSLEARPDDDAVVADLLRHAHSLKGASKLVGATALERLTHALETVLAEVKARHLAPSTDAADTMLASIDAMRVALTRLMEGVTDTGSEGIVSRLLALAASGPNLDDRLTSALPGLDAEIRDVLTEFQKSQLVLARSAGKTVWECELSAPEAKFASRIDKAYDALKQNGDVISLAGLSSPVEGTLRFKFVVSTRQSPEKFTALTAQLSLVATDPSVAPAPTPAEPVSDEDAEFLAEMAKLIVRYVTEAADELEETTKLILTLESNPNDAGTINKLFRTAHSFKGSGMTYGLAAVTEVAHHMETVLDALREQRVAVSPRITNALLAGTDALKELFARAKGGQSANAAPANVLKLLDAAIKGDTGEAEAAPAPAAPARAVAAPSESIRVRLNKLDQLVNLAGELTTVRNTRDAMREDIEHHSVAAKSLFRLWQSLRDRLPADVRARGQMREHGWLDDYDDLGKRVASLRASLDEFWNRFTGTMSIAGAATSALHEAVMQIRMVPIGSLFDTAPRMIRDLTSDRKKRVELRISGEATELDKRVLELMTDPLMHLLRNAVDHGIEPIEERRHAGKTDAGVIELSARHLGGAIEVSIHDDGRGLNPERLVTSAVAKGIVSPQDAGRVTKEQAYALIFTPGFSTKEEVTAISGRGVGMDVVKSNIDALKGRIDIESEVGKGTTFRVQLPLSISMIQVVVVECASHTFCLPATGVTEIIRVDDDDLQHEDGKPIVPHRGRAIAIVRLSDLLGLDDRRPLGQSAIVIAKGIEGEVGLVVDRAASEQTVLVKEIGKLLQHVPHVAGGTILPDGRVAVILDAISLVSIAIRESRTWVEGKVAAQPIARKTLLVVDDSLTTRELIRGLLESAGYDVVTARHGREAWELLQTSRTLDLVVSDVNMPEMDGYELTSRIKNDARLSHLPVVLVTSLAKPEEKQRGADAGADGYIVKAGFDERALLDAVARVLASDP